jgi:hypothetical protein
MQRHDECEIRIIDLNADYVRLLLLIHYVY